MSEPKNVNVSVGFLGWLTLLFIGLKLTGYIDWSWWFVLMPIYIVPAVLLFVAMLFLLLAGVLKVFDK